MGQSPEVVGSIPLDRKISMEDKVYASLAFTKVLKGKIVEEKAKDLIIDIISDLKEIGTIRDLSYYLKDARSKAFDLRADEHITIIDKDLILEGLNIIAEECDLSLGRIRQRH